MPGVAHVLAEFIPPLGGANRFPQSEKLLAQAHGLDALTSTPPERLTMAGDLPKQQKPISHHPTFFIY